MDLHKCARNRRVACEWSVLVLRVLTMKRSPEKIIVGQALLKDARGSLPSGALIPEMEMVLKLQ